MAFYSILNHFPIFFDHFHIKNPQNPLKIRYFSTISPSKPSKTVIFQLFLYQNPLKIRHFSTISLSKTLNFPHFPTIFFFHPQTPPKTLQNPSKPLNFPHFPPISISKSTHSTTFLIRYRLELSDNSVISRVFRSWDLDDLQSSPKNVHVFKKNTTQVTKVSLAVTALKVAIIAGSVFLTDHLRTLAVVNLAISVLFWVFSVLLPRFVIENGQI
jgi:hypothetical protein